MLRLGKDLQGARNLLELKVGKVEINPRECKISRSPMGDKKQAPEGHPDAVTTSLISVGKWLSGQRVLEGL